MNAFPEWTEDRVEDLLQHPHRLVEKEPWRSVIAAAGGLAALYDRLRQLPLKAKQAAVLHLLLDHPGAGVAAYTDLLHIHPTTFARQQRALIQSLVLQLNTAPPAAGGAVAPGLPRQLRPPVSDFVGRADELDRLAEALRGATIAEGAALAAIHGMGGAGKTELATLAAHQLRDHFPDGQIVLDLRGAGDSPLAPEQALQTAIRAFVVQDKLPTELPALEDLYRSALAGKRVLILADDARDAAHARPLVPPAGCALLVTTRQRWTLPGLASVHLDPLPPGEASALLREISGRLNDAEAADLTRVVGALPLALRVAGALLRNNPALSVAAYQERLAAADRRLGALRDPDDPQLNVEASLNLSYDALPVSAQAALRQLGALVADFDISLGLALIGRDDRGEEDLYALLRRNLVSYDPASTRWRLHDLIRSQALRKLIDAGEFAAASWRYVDAVLDIIRPLHTTMHSDSWNRNEALARFDRERPHLGEIWEWASAHQGEPAADRVLIDFALHTANIGNLRFDLRNERLPQLSAALAAAQRSNNEMAAVRLLNGRATIYNRLGLLREAIAANTEALDRIRKIDGHDEIEKALILRDKALLSTKLGTDEGLRLSNTLNYEALDIFKKHRVSRHIHFTLNNIGVTHLGLREFDQAITILNELLILGRDEQLEESERLAVHNLAETYMRIGKIEQALPLYEQSATIAAKNGNLLSQAYALEGIGRAYAMLGSPEQAFDHFERSLGILQSKNAAWAIAICQWSYGLALVRYGDSERGLPRLRACLAYEESVGYENIAVHRALVERIEAGGGLSQDELAGIIV